jgi:general stress protein YciG
MTTTQQQGRRGFAGMSPERQRELAVKGGKSVPGDKRTFSKDRDLAAAAGRKGGKAQRANRSFSNRAFAAEAGRKGGMAKRGAGKRDGASA